MKRQRCAKLDVVIYLDPFIGGAVIGIYCVTVIIYYIACCDMIKENVNFNCTLNVLFYFLKEIQAAVMFLQIKLCSKF